MKKILTNKDIRRFFWAESAAVGLLLLFSMLLSQLIVHDFKALMLAHDYEVAGYLLEHGASPSEVAAAFTDAKTQQQYCSGQTLLQTLGYKEGIRNYLLPAAHALLTRYRLILGLFTVLMGAFLGGVFFLYFQRQQKTLAVAAVTIGNFMSGDISVRLDSEKEGSLSQLFATINSMSTTLNAHIEAQRNTKEFLRSTISDISHQLKTPLSALKMYNEIMQAESTNAEVIKDFSGKATQAINRMETLIKNLLKITRLDAGTITMNKSWESISRLMREIVTSFETRAEQEKKSITISGPDESRLFCDGYWLTEAIGNLVKNGLDHTEAGGKIEITWEETPAITRITVKDNGSGIHPEDIHHIFKRFYRSRFSQIIESVGLGLPLAQSIIEANNGTISVTSIPGESSTFTVDFLQLTEL